MTKNAKKSGVHYKNVKEAFPEALKKTKGFVQMACQITGINRMTYYRWLESDPKFAAACEKAMEYSCAFIESRWLKNIEKGSQGAIDKWLKYKGKAFGYVEEVSIENAPYETQLSEEDLQILETYKVKSKT